MKILKTVGIVLLSVIVLCLVISFFLPSKVNVERSRVINAKPDAVYAQIANLKSWDNWMPWNQLDPNMQKTYGEKTEGQGASYSWVSENQNVGKGSITLTKCDSNMVETELVFEGMNPGKGCYKLEPEGEGTKVTWSMESDMGNNPLYKFMALMMDGMIGPEFEKGLVALEKAAQANPIPEPLEQIVTTPTDSTQTATTPAEPAKS
jgi:hypothetical protein